MSKGNGQASSSASDDPAKSSTSADRDRVPAAAGQPGLRVNTDQLKSSYCNVCNVTSTREEVVLNFGINSNWDQNPPQQPDVQLHHRIILSPFAAKRLSELMANLIVEHERRHGELK
jgi:hypothetical protein